MSTNQLRREVLHCYKQLMRTRQRIFSQDDHALEVTKTKVREEFHNNRQLVEVEEIRRAVKVGHDAIDILNKTVLQARLNERGNYETVIKQVHLD